MSTVRISIAGSSGSIGTQTLDVIRAENARHSQGRSDVEYVVHGLGLGSSIDVLVAQAREFQPVVVAVADETRHTEVREALPGIRVVRDMADLVRPLGPCVLTGHDIAAQVDGYGVRAVHAALLAKGLDGPPALDRGVEFVDALAEAKGVGIFDQSLEDRTGEAV